MKTSGKRLLIVCAMLGTLGFKGISEIPMSETEFDIWFTSQVGARPSIYTAAQLRERYGEARQTLERFEREMLATSEWDRRYLTALSAFRLGAGIKVDKRVKYGS